MDKFINGPEIGEICPFGIFYTTSTHVETVCQLVRTKEDISHRNFKYREEEIPDCACIYG